MCDSSETDTASESELDELEDVEPVEAALLRSLAQPHTDHGTTLSCLRCKTFYDRVIKLDADRRLDLETHTRKQSVEPLWHEARKLRITASTAGKVPKRESTDPTNFLSEHLHPKFLGTTATNYGRQCEEHAKNHIRERGCTITERGLIVCAGEPWLAASPDGIINSKLLEIKCPMSLSGCSSISEALADKTKDVYMEDGQYVINPKGPRGYYRQVQLGMHCLNVTEAVLVIWTPTEHLELDVPYDQEFVRASIQKLQAFYFKYMLPRIVDEFVEGRLNLHNYLKQLS